MPKSLMLTMFLTLFASVYTVQLYSNTSEKLTVTTTKKLKTSTFKKVAFETF